MQSLTNVNKNQVINFVGAHFLEFIKEDKITCKEAMLKLFVRQLFFAISDKNSIYYDGIKVYSKYNALKLTIGDSKKIDKITFHINNKKTICLLHKQVYFILLCKDDVIVSFIKIIPNNIL